MRAVLMVAVAVRALEGFVRLRCERADGAVFEGDVRFDNCSI